jgi:hypothetical protein
MGRTENPFSAKAHAEVAERHLEEAIKLLQMAVREDERFRGELDVTRHVRWMLRQNLQQD